MVETYVKAREDELAVVSFLARTNLADQVGKKS